MSGTSLDGVDVVAFDVTQQSVVGAYSVAFDESLRADCLALQAPQTDEIARAQIVANQLADLYAQAIDQLRQNLSLAHESIAAVGVHGQTIRHRPEHSYTIQLNQPARIAEQTGLTVVSDFRARDIAAGGQGAPLVPAFHDAIWRDKRLNRVILNVGGFANISVLNVGADAFGYDTGPGNVLMDAWISEHLGHTYDASGQWASTGTVHQNLLNRLLDEPYFQQPPPKSTGRDSFHLPWLYKHLADFNDISAADVQATLLRLTCQTILNEINRSSVNLHELIICGGGAYNQQLIKQLAHALPAVRVQTSAAHGIAPEHVEAAAFAWLAAQTIQGKTSNLPAVTGARGARILGNITLA
ncbi:anhydro-N-acetylmuramic acid kinase [Formosimonas limnophila]|uniref:Anhydro-N-acetylmuramic acid kinase n=2 Tax=Formosimonas limnophila TaxID=1384487 RepID=A0A8J3FY41_9BURK|nr:anhydro-N-acetylmuramic acid kinase [Formosimonas limnophila]